MAEEYIEREAAKRKYCETCNWYGTDLCNGCESPMSRIPAADVAPVRPGKWEYTSGSPRIIYGGRGTQFLCSCCGRKQGVKTNFCPNCGAKMETKDHADS